MAVNPDLIDCGCRKCRRGGRCDWIASLYAEATATRDREGKLAALTPVDREWLAARGWNGQ